MKTELVKKMGGGLLQLFQSKRQLRYGCTSALFYVMQSISFTINNDKVTVVPVIPDEFQN